MTYLVQLCKVKNKLVILVSYIFYTSYFYSRVMLNDWTRSFKIGVALTLLHLMPSVEQARKSFHTFSSSLCLLSLFFLPHFLSLLNLFFHSLSKYLLFYLLACFCLSLFISSRIIIFQWTR